jgi:hypothetical protein
MRSYRVKNLDMSFTENDTVLSTSLACTKVLLAFIYLNVIVLNTNRDVQALKES